MTGAARELLETFRRELAPAKGANRLLPDLIAGTAPRSVFTALAGEQHHIITSDWRSFLAMAARCDDPAGREFYEGLVRGEQQALRELAVFATAAGLDADGLRRYEPRPGCQTYPAYLAWLALNADPVEAILALLANFAAWGDYCGTVARAMREHYGFTGEQCGFFDFFATPVPEVDDQAVAILQAALDTGRALDGARRYGRTVQSYELMFWNTLADDLL